MKTVRSADFVLISWLPFRIMACAFLAHEVLRFGTPWPQLPVGDRSNHTWVVDVKIAIDLFVKCLEHVFGL